MSETRSCRDPTPSRISGTAREQGHRPLRLKLVFHSLGVKDSAQRFPPIDCETRTSIDQCIFDCQALFLTGL